MPRTTAHRLLMLGLLFMLFCRTHPCGAADWYVTPSVELNQEYNSNVLFSRFDKVDDFITRVRPRMEGHRDTETARLNFDVLLNLEKYISNPELDTVDTTSRASWTQDWSERFQTQLSGLFVKDQTLETELEEAGVLSARADRYRYGGDLSASYSLSERWALGASGLTRYDDYPDGQFPNLAQFQGNVSLNRAFGDRDTAGVVLGYSNADYDNETSTRTASANLTWVRRFTETSSLDFQAGYSYTEQDRELRFFRFVLNPDGTIGRRIVTLDDSTTDSGFVFALSYNKSWSERFTTSVSAGRDQYASSDTASVNRTYVRTGNRYRITERTTAAMDLGFDWTSPIRDVGQEDEYFFRASPSLSYQLTEQLFLRVGCSYEYNFVDRDLDPYSRNRVKTFVSLSTSWPRLWGSF